MTSNVERNHSCMKSSRNPIPPLPLQDEEPLSGNKIFLIADYGVADYANRSQVLPLRAQQPSLVPAGSGSSSSSSFNEIFHPIKGEWDYFEKGPKKEHFKEPFPGGKVLTLWATLRVDPSYNVNSHVEKHQQKPSLKWAPLPRCWVIWEPLKVLSCNLGRFKCTFCLWTWTIREGIAEGERNKWAKIKWKRPAKSHSRELWH